MEEAVDAEDMVGDESDVFLWGMANDLRDGCVSKQIVLGQYPRANPYRRMRRGYTIHIRIDGHIAAEGKRLFIYLP